MKVIEASNSEATQWENFIRSQAPDGHFFAWAWRGIIEHVFGHRPHYLMVVTDNADGTKTVHGVLPLFEFRSFLFGKALISLPYLNGGGILAVSDQAARFLLDRAKDLLRELEFDFLELRLRVERPQWANNLPSKSHKVAMRLALLETPDAVFASFQKKLRSQIRRPEKSGMTTTIESGDEITPSSVRAFFAVFSENMRDLGSPTYPKLLFTETLRAFGQQAKLVLVFKASTPVAAGITLGHCASVEIPWASSRKAWNHESPNMLLYWTAISQACRDGYSCFDFGRSSPDSGTYRFKKQWGAVEAPLTWTYVLGKGAMPDVNPKSAKFHLVSQVWSRLPLVIVNQLGPYLTRNIPS